MSDQAPPLLEALEPGQRAIEAGRKLPRRRLGRLSIALLIGLRIYVILAIPIVAYAFVHALHAQ